MSLRPQPSLTAWSYLLLGAFLFFGPWVWPLWVLRNDSWANLIHEYAEIFNGLPFLVVPLTVWVLALSLAGLALIVLAFRRPR
jgi:hypothetical protein